MESTKIIFEDAEKIIYEITGATTGFPDWILMGGDQVGKCLLTYDVDGSFKPSSMYYGTQHGHPETKTFMIKVKQPTRPNEVYGLSFEGTKTSRLACYNEGQWEISLHQILEKFPNLNQVPEIKHWGKKYAVPGLIFDTNTVDEQFEATKARAAKIASAKLQDLGVLGSMERESIFQWHVGIPDYGNLKQWIPIRMMWNKIKEQTQTLAGAIVHYQHARSFDHNIESSRVILTQVVQPFCDQHNVTRIAHKHNMAPQLQAQQQWLSIQLSNLVRESFVEAFQNE